MNASPAQSPTSFRHWAQDKSLAECLSLAESGVRAKPTDAQARWLLVELLCVHGQWDRALRQLQAWAGMSRKAEPTAHLMRGLIRSERQREQVLGGQRKFASIAPAGSTAGSWMGALWKALEHSGGNEKAHDRSARDAQRNDALALAPDTPGECPAFASPFHWITDTDSRLGPVCEVVVMGSYRWLALDDLRSLHKQAPGSLVDLAWSPVRLELRDGTPLQAYMPMRYPVREGDRDATLLARETVWTEDGGTGVLGHGQKMWTTDQGDIALLNLRDCCFHGCALRAVAQAAP
mgnify:CR=1 FL=1